MKKIGYKIFLSIILGINLLSNSAFAQDKDANMKKSYMNMTSYIIKRCIRNKIIEQ